MESESTLFVTYSVIPEGKAKGMSAIKEFFDSRSKGFTSKELQREVLRYIPIKNGVDTWLASFENNETKRKYKWALHKLFSQKPASLPIDEDTPIQALSCYDSQGMYQVIREWKETDATKRMCQTVYAKFCAYISAQTKGFIEAEPRPIEKKNYYKAKEIYEQVADWPAFIDSLEEPHSLIAELIFLSGRFYQHRLRISDPRRNLLSLDTTQINFVENTICFRNWQTYHTMDSCILRYPEDFMDKLKAYMGSRIGPVFLSKEEKNLFPKQVERAFAKASKNLNLPCAITPVLLSWIGVLFGKEERFKDLDIAQITKNEGV